MPGFWWLLQRNLRKPKKVRKSFGGCFEDISLIDGEFEERIIGPLAENNDRMRGHAKFLKGWDWDLLDSWEHKHAKLKMPVLMIWGANDENFPLSDGENPDAEKMALQFPDARLVTIDGARLLVHEEKPQKVAAAALAFLLPESESAPDEGA